ncbi:hypothetical protein T09_12421 [Trichinella sp. T9]|nr:hypothetical protein T09_12421 [Trichinella sp. T9]
MTIKLYGERTGREIEPHNFWINQLAEQPEKRYIQCPMIIDVICFMAQ